ncbi:MAG: DUF4299 family protein [Clostridia bacterium]|nr:DUF4299 family protein [Clostridia bacterium]
MSIDIVIRQKGLFKKTLPLSVILGDNLACGVYEAGYRLDPGEWKSEDGEIVVYDPHHKGRGFSVIWTPTQKKGVTLRALHPTSTYELKAFYATVARITDYWSCSLEVDGNPMTPAEFQAGLSNMLEANDRYLDLFIKESMDKEPYESMTLFSAFWPLEFGSKEAAEVKDAPEGAPARFARWLHEMQSVDTYYAVAGYMEEKDGIVSRFAFTEDCDSLFPVKPSVPFGITGADGKPLEVSRYEVAIVATSTPSVSVIGTIPYEAFMAALSPDKVSYYDAKRVRIAPHSLSELKELISKAGV